MAGYNTIRGLRVKYLSSDPATSEEGQVWYNSFTGNLRLNGYNAGTWASAANRSRQVGNSSFAGTPTAGLSVGGYIANPGFSHQISTEEFNGSSWSNGGNINPPQGTSGGSGSGTQTAALIAGNVVGGPGTSTYVATTFEYDGSSWTNGGNMQTSPYRSYTSNTAGTQTASLYSTGQLAPGTRSTATEEYNGSSWTGGGVYPTGLARVTGCGTQTAATAFLGSAPGVPNTTLACSYNGSSWTAITSTNEERSDAGGAGSQDNALGMGGYKSGVGVTAAVELWNGTSWTAQNSLANAGPTSMRGPSSVNTASALAVQDSSVEEWTGPSAAIYNVTAS